MIMDRFSIESVLLAVLFVLIAQVCGQLCPGGDIQCDYDEYCCEGICCDKYGNGYYANDGFWNIWYFWFIIFFILMTCCGGCGFYRRRQAYLTQTRGTIITTQPIMVPPPQQHNVHVGVVGPYPAHTMPQGEFQGPPSYNEAVTKPHLYPKSDVVYPPTMPINGASPMSQPAPAYQTDPAYPPNPTSPPPATYYQSGMPMPQPSYTPVSPTVGAGPEPPPYSAAEVMSPPTAPPNSS